LQVQNADRESTSITRTAETRDQQELLKLYEEICGQLTALKHITYSSTYLSDPESLAVLFSRQILKWVHQLNNSVWLVRGDSIKEVAMNGERVAEDRGLAFEIASSEILNRVVKNQIIVWSSEWPRMKEWLPGFQAPALIPIRSKGETFGFLAVDRPSPEKMDLHQFIAQFAGMIFDISHLYRNIDEQRKELSEITNLLMAQNTHMATLHHAGLKILKTTKPGRLWELITETLVMDFHVRRAATLAIDEESSELRGTSGSGDLQDILDVRIPIHQNRAIKHCIDSGRITSYQDYDEALQLGPHQVENWLLFPFKGKERPLGVLVVQADDSDLSDPIAILINHASMVLDNLLIMEERKRFNKLLATKTEELTQANEALLKANELLNRMCNIDCLTDLYNHRYFQDRFHEEFSRAERYWNLLALIIADLDHFKLINDSFGHSVGDQVLVEVAGRIRKSLRISDVVARYGGEEIAILLPETDLEAAIFTAEKLRAAVGSHPVMVNGEPIPISISLGVAAFPGHGVFTRRDLFNRADQALYLAKENGRNRVETISDPIQQTTAGGCL